MAQETATSVKHFQQLRNRQNDLYRKNTAAIMAAAKANDRDAVAKLAAERAKLSENDRLILEAELKFQASVLSQSEAEKRLMAQTRRANSMVKAVKTVSQVLTSAGKMAGILSRLIAIL